MTVPTVGTDASHDTTSGATVSPAVAPRPKGWVELALLGVLYAAYSLTRNQFGSATGDSALAYANALRVIAWEEALGIYHERSVQAHVLDWPIVIEAWNVFYGTFHFVVPIVVLAALWRRRPDAYPLRRTALVAATVLALIGFSAFPLMPPRLLCDCPGGGGVDHGFVDTLAVYGGLWSFENDGLQALSNQYAAMPSLHFGWALWAAMAAQVLLASRRQRLAAFAYPALTLVAIVVTGNHFVLDAVGGAAVVLAGWGIAMAIDAALARRRGRLLRPEDVGATPPGGYRGP